MISIQEVYALFVQYFENPTFHKIKNTDDYSIYMCKLNVQLSNVNRYLVCIVDRDVFFMNDTQTLSELRWRVFQTRGLTDTYPTLTSRHSYRPKRGGLFETRLHRTSKTPEQVNYSCENAPLTIGLLPSPDNLFDYPATGTLNSALETYNTIVEKIEK